MLILWIGYKDEYMLITTNALMCLLFRYGEHYRVQLRKGDRGLGLQFTTSTEQEHVQGCAAGGGGGGKSFRVFLLGIACGEQL